MKKEYRYRAHIRWGQYVIFPVFILLPTLVFIAAILAKPVSFSNLPADIAFLIAGILLGFLFGGILLGFIYRRLAVTRVSFDEQGIVWYRGRNRTHLPFEEISKLSFPSVSYTGGWIKIVYGDKKFRLTVVLENISGFLAELKSALDDRGLSERYDQTKFFKFTKTATYSDQSWDRFYSIFWKLLALSGLAVILGLAFATLNGSGFLGILVWTTASLLWPIAVWVVAELILMRRFAKRCDKNSLTCPPRDIPYEKALLQKGALWGTVIYLAVSQLLLFLI